MTFHAVPIVDVHTDNFRQLWPSILLAVKSSSFIALDLELSGLGNRKLLNACSVEERYKAISHAAKTRSIISLGLSCFKLLLDENTGTNQMQSHQMWKYYVQTFNITTLCSQEYIVEPEALKFLIRHGFDFNQQYAKGVAYYKGNDKDDDSSDPSIRSLFAEIISANRSLVLHNGLVDVIFMYQSWYADLPSSMGSFAADLYEACPGGIYDTKYIAEFFARTSASYLEYVFRKLQRENEVKATGQRPHVSISFMKFKPDMPYIEYRQLSVDTTGYNTVPPSRVCMTYAYHGWCPNAATCTLSHNVDCVLDMEGGPQKRKQKRKLPQMQMCNAYPSRKKLKRISVAQEVKLKSGEPLSGQANHDQSNEVSSLLTNDEPQKQNTTLPESHDSAISVTSTKEENQQEVDERDRSTRPTSNGNHEDHKTPDLLTDSFPQCDTEQTSDSQVLDVCSHSHENDTEKVEPLLPQDSSLSPLTIVNDDEQPCANSVPNQLETQELVSLISEKDLQPISDDQHDNGHLGESLNDNCEHPHVNISEIPKSSSLGEVTKETPQKDSVFLAEELILTPTKNEVESDICENDIQDAEIPPSTKNIETPTKNEVDSDVRENDIQDGKIHSSAKNIQTPTKTGMGDSEVCKNGIQGVKSLASMCSIKSKENDADQKTKVCSSADDDNDESVSRLGQKSRGHRAGCDAFMTGFIMAIFLARFGVRPSKVSNFTPESTHTEELLNKMYLSGKSVPFLIRKSQYAKTSKSHEEKKKKLQQSSDQMFKL